MTDVADCTTYPGDELAVFAQARFWKSYLRRMIQPHLGRTVLEVGAGLGGTTRFLCTGSHDAWYCLEPDRELLALIESDVSTGSLPVCCRPIAGTLVDLPDDVRADTILYIDVLEHIEDDRGELCLASKRLRPGGSLVVLSPAHPSLYTPFDRAIGHYRRYTRSSLSVLSPPGVELTTLRYLDSAGLLASLANRWLLRSSMPTAGQVRIWDRWLVRSSRWIDRLLGYQLGKSVFGVWRKPQA